jgi:hypothetical protein
MAEPLIRIVLRDEFTAQVQVMKDRLKQVNAEVRTGKAQQEFKALETSVKSAANEIRTAVRITGAGALISGGFLATVTAINRQLDSFAHEKLQLHYTAQELGTTVENIEHLVNVGRALGQTREQAAAGVTGLISGLRNLQTFGPVSKEWQALAEGARGSGIRLANDLTAAMRSGGVKAATKLAFERMKEMAPEARKSFSEIFNMGTVAWMDAMEIGPLRERVHIGEGALRRYMVSMINLDTSLQNVKDRIGIAVMPAFDRLMEKLDNFLSSSGVGAKLENYFTRFANFLETGIDWEVFGKNMKWIFDQLRSFFRWLRLTLRQMDPYVKQMGGWSTIITGALVVGAIGWFTGVGFGLATMAKWAAFLPLIATGAAIAGAVKTEGSDPTKQSSEDTTKLQSGATNTTQQQQEAAAQREKVIAEMRAAALAGGMSGTVPGYARLQQGTMRRPGARGQRPREASTQAQYFMTQTRRQNEGLSETVQGVTQQIKKMNDFYSLFRVQESAAQFFTGGGGGPGGGGGDGPPGGGGDTGPKVIPGSRAPLVPGHVPGQTPPDPRKFTVTPSAGTPIVAGRGGYVSKTELQDRLGILIKNSGLSGYVPPDGARYGIKTGSAEEWAALMTNLAGGESSFRATTHGDKGSFGGYGSRGLFQLSPQDAITYGIQRTPFTIAQLEDPDFNARVAVIIAAKLARQGGIGNPVNGMAQYWAGAKGRLARGDYGVGRYGTIVRPPAAAQNVPVENLTVKPDDSRPIDPSLFDPNPILPYDSPADKALKGTDRPGMTTSGGDVRLGERGAHDYTRGGVKTQAWLIDTVQQATRALPPGYVAEVISTVDQRARTPWHPSGRAIDIQIYRIDENGKRIAIPNTGNRNVPGYEIYERVALAAKQYAARVYPNQTFIWGGHFNSGVPYDRMHFQSGGVSARGFTREQLDTPVLPGFGVKPGNITPDGKPADGVKELKTIPQSPPDDSILFDPSPLERRLNVNVKVRASRNTKVRTDSSKNIDMKIDRNMTTPDETAFA